MSLNKRSKLADEEITAECLSLFRSCSTAMAQVTVIHTLIAACTMTQLSLVYQFILDRLKFDIVSRLPLELSWKILGMIDSLSISSCFQVCKSWHFILSDDSQFQTRCIDLGVSKSAESWNETFRRVIAVNVNWRTAETREKLLHEP